MIGIIIALVTAAALALIRFSRLKRRGVGPGGYFFTKSEELVFLIVAIMVAALFLIEGIKGDYKLFSLASIYWTLGVVLIIISLGLIVRLVLKPRADRH